MPMVSRATKQPGASPARSSWHAPKRCCRQSRPAPPRRRTAPRPPRHRARLPRGRPNQHRNPSPLRWQRPRDRPHVQGGDGAGARLWLQRLVLLRLGHSQLDGGSLASGGAGGLFRDGPDTLSSSSFGTSGKLAAG